MAKLYPDISHHHPVKNWSLFAGAVAFAISKGTQGTGFVDPYMKTFVSECEAHKIPYWLYTYLNKGNELAQTKFLVKTCAPYVGKFFQGYALDAEEDNSAAGVKEALDWLKAQGGKCLLYISGEAKYKELIATRGKNVAWWEARYGRDDGTYNPKYPCHVGVDLHQYTSNGVCPGVPDKIDLNRLTGTLPEAWFTGKDSNSPEKPTTTQGYPGAFPSLPARGYYTIGDGYQQNPGLQMDIKKLQELINWINGGRIAVDGMYGANTAAAVKLAQTTLKVTTDGLFGSKTLLAAKAYKK